MAAIIGICLSAQGALAATPAKPPAPPTFSVFLPPAHPGDPTGCSDAFYHVLPGLTNFCSGVRDWELGHYRAGLEFLTLAAGWGSKGAQYMLGLIYYNGKHVAADHALGIAWLELADERHDNQQIASILRATLKYATPAERARGQQLFAEMGKRYGDKVAAKRSWEQFVHWRELMAWQMGGQLGGSGANGCIFLTTSQAGGFGRPTQPASPRVTAQRRQNPNAGGGAGQSCVSIATYNLAASTLASSYFNGWTGLVKVEPLQQIPPASTPAH